MDLSSCNSLKHCVFVPSQIVKRIPWRFLLLLVFLIILTACDSSSTGSSTNGYSNSFSTINSNSSSSSLDKVTALQMLHTMCNAVVNKDLQTGDFSQLYSMTSSSFQAHYSLNDMVTRMRGALRELAGYPDDNAYNPLYPTATSCSVDAEFISITTYTNPAVTLAEGRVSWGFANGQSGSDTSQLEAENGAWKIYWVLERMQSQCTGSICH